MNPKEPRSLWLVTKDGVPVDFAWGLVKTPEESPPNVRPSWAAALTEKQPTSEGWNATPTRWRNVPPLVRKRLLGVAAPPRVVGRELEHGGCRWDLDTTGRPRGPGLEPCCPDAELVDEDELLELVEAVDHRQEQEVIARAQKQAAAAGLMQANARAHEHLARAQRKPFEVQLVERGTLRRVRVSPRRDAQARGEDVLIHRDERGERRRMEKAPAG